MNKENSTNKHENAIVLEYESSGTPIVSAKGEKFMADYIIELAKKYNKPIVKKASVAKLLSSIPEETEIPPSLYEAVAQILYEIEKN